MSEPDTQDPFATELFFITPIGAAGSEARRRADGVQQTVLEPIAEARGLRVVRADKISGGGNVTMQVIEHCTRAALAVADLSGTNLNVYYEVGLRHALRLPTVLIAEANTALPFDLLQQRTNFYVDEMNGVDGCLKAVDRALGEALLGRIDSPVEHVQRRDALADGDPGQQAIAELIDVVQDLAARVGAVGSPATPPDPASRRFIRVDELDPPLRVAVPPSSRPGSAMRTLANKNPGLIQAWGATSGRYQVTLAEGTAPELQEAVAAAAAEDGVEVIVHVLDDDG